jgi:hypothetical protein
MSGACSMYGGTEECIKIWSKNIKMDLKETRPEFVNCNHLAKVKVQLWIVGNMITKFKFP